MACLGRQHRKRRRRREAYNISYRSIWDVTIFISVMGEGAEGRGQELGVEESFHPSPTTRGHSIIEVVFLHTGCFPWDLKNFYEYLGRRRP